MRPGVLKPAPSIEKGPGIGADPGEVGRGDRVLGSGEENPSPRLVEVSELQDDGRNVTGHRAVGEGALGLQSVEPGTGVNRHAEFACDTRQTRDQPLGLAEHLDVEILSTLAGEPKASLHPLHHVRREVIGAIEGSRDLRFGCALIGDPLLGDDPGAPSKHKYLLHGGGVRLGGLCRST